MNIIPNRLPPIENSSASNVNLNQEKIGLKDNNIPLNNIQSSPTERQQINNIDNKNEDKTVDQVQVYQNNLNNQPQIITNQNQPVPLQLNPNSSVVQNNLNTSVMIFDPNPLKSAAVQTVCPHCKKQITTNAIRRCDCVNLLCCCITCSCLCIPYLCFQCCRLSFSKPLLPYVWCLFKRIYCLLSLIIKIQLSKI